MIVKCGRREYDVTENDVVLYNGSCYQIITKNTGSGWDEYPVILAKAKAVKLIKEGALVKYKEEKRLKYYKFKVKQ